MKKDLPSSGKEIGQRALSRLSKIRTLPARRLIEESGRKEIEQESHS